MKIKYLIIGLLFLFVIISLSSSVSASTMILDPSVGEDSEVVKFGELKYNWRVELTVTNNHDICNVSAEIGKYAYGDHIYPFYTGSSSIVLKSGETETATYNHTEPEILEEGAVRIFSYLNRSAYTDQQTSVEVIYKIKVYNDRGEVVVDSEDPLKNENIKEPEPISGPCGSSILIVTGVFSSMICFGVIKFRKKI
jgi:hypothetical protein